MLVLASMSQLHIPDGFLTIVIAAACWIITLITLYVAAQKAQEVFDERLVPLAGIMAAFIFAAQMLNFPVAGGTSGHFIGAALATIVLGPWLGILVMTSVIMLQALLFQDGGLVAMGANVLVMGIIPAFVGFGLTRSFLNRPLGQRLGIIGVASWLSLMAAAFVVALLLWLSNTSALGVVVPAMLGVHSIIGLGEAAITVAAYAFIVRTRPEMVEKGKASGGRNWVIGGVLLALFLILFAPLASSSPDGLEWVAGQQGFLETAQSAPFEILPDYTVPFLGDGSVSTIVAGLIGALLVFALAFALVRTLRRSSL
ncbi:MAG: energy-coupling factor ABC transporter permease [Chloroflexi bacterium]|nr:energy-coupling factor ABC transporter permease [Chloroflexota bacterium]MBP8059325.1 energy-coupling factor ABC transporter permease [Chloroflexota bacterium]